MRTESVLFPFFFSGGTVIDVETDHSQHLTCFGYVSGNSAVSVIADTDFDFNFNLEVRHLLDDLKRPFFAFNKGFEERVLNTKFDKEIQLRPYEKKKYAIRVNGIRDPFVGDGYLCMESWARFLESGNDLERSKILNHNLSCLLQELCLVVLGGHREG